MKHMVPALVLSAAFPLPALSGPVAEARIGLTQHNTCILDCDNANKEDGPNVSAEITWRSPGMLRPLAAPRPYLGASLNTAGDTSLVGAGLVWNVKLAGSWSLEPGLGYFIHNGALTFPFPQGDPRNNPFTSSHVLFGSRDLFRTSLAINHDLSQRWGAQLIFEHYSHGQILGDGRNQGLDNVGVRLRYRFGE